MPASLHTGPIEWPTKDEDLDDPAEYTAFLERLSDALRALPTQSADTEVPIQLSAADANILRPMLDKIRAQSPEITFSFFTPPERDAARSDGA